MRQFLLILLSLLVGMSVAGQEYSEELEKRARQGDAQAQYELYQCLLYGFDIDYDTDEAESWLIKSAEAGYAPAQYEMGNLCRMEPAFDSDTASIEDPVLAVVRAAVESAQDIGYTKEGVEWIRRAAEQNYQLAINRMGDIYFYGLGVPQSDSEALKWYQRALDNGEDVYEDDFSGIRHIIRALQGDPEALMELGDIKYVRQAADKGYLPAIQYLGDYYSNVDRVDDFSYYGEPIGSHFIVREVFNKDIDYAQAMKYYKLAARQGDTLALQRASLIEQMLSGNIEATFELCGLTYIDDINNDSTYHVVDDMLLRTIAEQGYVPAQYTFATYLDDQEDEEAEVWYKKAAEQDYEDAQTLLGYYYFGKDRYQEAIQAFKVAIDRNPDDLEATMGLGASFYWQNNYVEAIPWLEIVAASDDENDADNAAIFLGVSHYNLKNFPEAIKWLESVSDDPDRRSEAAYWIGMCYINIAYQINYVEAMRWFSMADNGPSNYQIALMYLYGNGVNQSQDEAVRYFRKALESYSVAVYGENDLFELEYGFSPATDMLQELGRDDVIQEFEYLYNNSDENNELQIEEDVFKSVKVTELRIVDDDYYQSYE